MKRVALLGLAVLLLSQIGIETAQAFTYNAPGPVVPKFIRRSRLAADDSVPIFLSWAPATSACCTEPSYYTLQQFTRGNWRTLVQIPATSYVINLPPDGSTYYFRVNARFNPPDNNKCC